MNKNGSLNEQPLHASLKQWYAGDDGRVEVLIGGYIADVFKENSIIEIQTGSFSSIKSKMIELAAEHELKLVYPIAAEKWLFKYMEGNSAETTTRKSPKRGFQAEVFTELVSFPELLCSERFSLEIAMIREQEVRVYTGEKPWRQHGWVTIERQLLEVLETQTFRNPGDFLELLPPGLPDHFTTQDISKYGKVPRWLVQKMAYCLRNMGAIKQIGKKGRSYLYIQSGEQKIN